jgi:hypothetical protein
VFKKGIYAYEGGRKVVVACREPVNLFPGFLLVINENTRLLSTRQFSIGKRKVEDSGRYLFAVFRA